MTRQKIAAVTGASSSGKTQLALKLARKFNGEIISADSRQIYKELDIGTAKLMPGEMQGIKHHLINIRNITQDYTAADFYDDAKECIKDIAARGKLPIIAGGTGLYFRILLQDFDLPRTAPDKELRLELEKQSSEELHKRLKELDFEISQKIHPNNKVKIIRALEVCINLGSPMSRAQKKKDAEFDVLWLGLESSDRQFLYDRINRRTDIMLEKGLLKEAENLFNKYGENKILLDTIGYKEFAPYFKGQRLLEDAVNLLKQDTRRYAKRQICWFNSNKDIKRFDIKTLSPAEIEEKAAELTEKFLG